MKVKIIKYVNLDIELKTKIKKILKDNFPNIKKFDNYKETNINLFTKKGNDNEEKIIGLVCTIENDIIKKYKSKKELFGYNITNEKGIYLYNFVVLKKYRNKGYGKRMINYIINYYKKLEKINYIYSLSTNDKSSNIFSKLGFNPGEHLLDKDNKFSRIFTKYLKY